MSFPTLYLNHVHLWAFFSMLESPRGLIYFSFMRICDNNKVWITQGYFTR